MSAMPPLPCRWDGESFAPMSQHWARQADKHFVVGEVYTLEVREERSALSHRHYFASIHEAWQNLPEAIAERFPTPEHLRKFALIRAGCRDERSISCASKAEALRLAAFIRPMDDFAIVVTDGAMVTVYTAKSQSMRAMSKQEFQKSKDAVLDFIAGLIGTKADDLERNAGEAA